MDLNKNTNSKLPQSKHDYEDDQYVKDLKQRMKIKKSKGIMDEDKFDVFYTNDNTELDKIATYRLRNSIQFWSQITIAIAISKLIYPRSIRFVKNTLNLQGFLNIHMGITPILLITNGIALGFFQGFWDSYMFTKELEL